MGKKTFTEDYYGNLLQVTLDEVEPEMKIDFIPDSIKEMVWEAMADQETAGEFDHDETGNFIWNEKDERQIYTTFQGRWQILSLDYSLIRRIVMWKWNHYSTEALTQELFREYFGNNLGDHFYSKWVHTYECDLMKMFGYFNTNMEQGQTFCNMLMRQVDVYTQREK